MSSLILFMAAVLVLSFVAALLTAVLVTKKQRDQARILGTFAKSVNGVPDQDGVLSWYSDTFYCRWEPSTRQKPAELKISIITGLPASEFLARGADGQVDSFGPAGVLPQITTSHRIGYSVFSRDPSYVEHLMSLGLSRRLAAGQDISYRIDPAGFIIVRKAFASPSTGWSLRTFHEAQSSGLRLAQLVSARPA